MKVSIIIPTYNEEHTIEKCLKSLGKQTYKDMEVIVVDDGSTDKTLRVLSEIRNSKFEIRVLRQSHRGPGEARNLGAKNAKGEILVFVDADMTFDPKFIEKLVEPIVERKVKGTFSREEIVSNWDNIWAKCWNINEGWEDGKRHAKDYPDTQKVFRAILKSEFDRVGGFDLGGHYTDDWSLGEKLGYEAVSAPGAVFYHENPETLSEIFYQAKWASKRQYKLGWLGWLFGLIRVSLPISLVVGIVKALLHRQPNFLVFKVVYNLGAFIGIIEYTFFGKGAK